jgi:hypothetical protein
VDQTDSGPSPGCKTDVQEIPNVVLEFSSRLLELYGVWYCHDEVVLLLPGGLDVFCEFRPEASTDLYSMMQNSHFHHASENGLRVFTENLKTR